jgi:hypothetical protein
VLIDLEVLDFEYISITRNNKDIYDNNLSNRIGHELALLQEPGQLLEFLSPTSVLYWAYVRRHQPSFYGLGR